MTVCQFFLQGRCRFGDRCWNEHPGARGAAGARQPPPAGSNRHGWNASNQRFSNVIQPSNFSRGPWGGSRDPDRASLGSSTSGGFGVSQSSFASLSSGEQDDQKMLETIIKDAEIWESSGQWMFSVYSPVKMKPIPGFTDISPEELRLEYHNFLTSNNLQSYFNSVQQLISQWKHKINELKSLNMSNKAALLSILGFGFTQASTFGSPGFSMNNSSNGSVKNFSFKASPGFAPSTSGSPSVFGSRPAFGATSTTGSAVSGLGKPQVTSAASFSFKTPAASGFGSPGFSALSASTAGSSFGPAVPPAFGSGGSVPGFGSPGSHSHSAFSKPSNNVFGGSCTSTSHQGADAISAADKALFTPKDQLTDEELEQFKSKKFTLGKIPLKPPPVELIRI